MNIDINCDLGEGKTLLDCKNDSMLMPYISSCNIACGAHAGNESIMLETLKNAKKYNLKIGAHPGYPDKENFGRRSIQISSSNLKQSLKQQINTLLSLAEQLDLSLHHIKFHGALYNDIEKSDSLSILIAKFIKDNFQNLNILGLAGGKLHNHCQKLNIKFIAEGFMDRLYLSSGQLTPRSMAGAIIRDKKTVISQAISLAKKEPILANDKTEIIPEVQSICLHGDNQDVLDLAKQLFSKLTDLNITISTNKKQFEIITNGDSALTVLFEEPIGKKLVQKILFLNNQLTKRLNANLTDVIPGYQSLTVCYNPLLIKPKLLKQEITEILKRKLSTINSMESQHSKLIEIPVCYDDDFAPDLNKISRHCCLSLNDIIYLHSKNEYLVHMLGFLPGFFYLGGLNKQLNCPRKNTPRNTVTAGSVGIGGSHTGIYPVSSPGGWQIIGRTPITLFNPERKNPAIASPLDRVKFVPISKQEFPRLPQ